MFSSKIKLSNYNTDKLEQEYIATKSDLKQIYVKIGSVHRTNATFELEMMYSMLCRQLYILEVILNKT